MINKISISTLLVLLISPSIVYSEEQTPTQKVENFLQMVQNGRINEAYDLLFNDQFQLLDSKQ